MPMKQVLMCNKATLITLEGRRIIMRSMLFIVKFVDIEVIKMNILSMDFLCKSLTDTPPTIPINIPSHRAVTISKLNGEK